MTLQIQFWTLFMMICGGMAMGAIYDLFRLLYEQLKLPRWTIIPMDITYWIVATILIFQMLYSSNQGQLRMFVFVGMVAGVLLYYFVFGKIVTKIYLFIFKMVTETYRIILKIFDIFLIRPAIILYKVVIILFGFLKAIAIFLYKIMIQLLYPVWKLVLWIKQRFVR
ncbi:spore cortex biosynthesis protein YabQ [Paenibacillus albiflavus]|uniref:Spore cortex biosynthesis protein YabQ n=1 Tax=Paenibacillus albiflavus TaxID=2545760 RepID=A0A4R4E927_9BACL|nr:spore cortex biosynthesis protein YabQ [Paenibacillus albiflavus]TCZ74328.1 spore cortex biosynthesis protein YabQ [Paenibacillus albiflavus]